MINNIRIDVSLTFVVLTYNHSGFVLEHLESIAHLIQKYGKVQKVDLIVSDDASKDSTVLEISSWLELNRNLFRNVITFYGSENIGTCKSFLRATENIKTRYVKVTGGDDLYSDENIFSAICCCGDAQLIGSQPLVLVGGVLQRSHKFNLIHALDNAVYMGQSFRRRLIGPGCIYTPGLIYSAEIVSDKRIRDFISKFVLVEDLPIWIAVSEYYPSVKYQISKAVLVYYRRTANSAYLISGGRVFADQLACQEHLLATEKSEFNRLIIRNRIWLINNLNPRLRKFFDFGRLVFVIKLSFRLPLAIRNLVDLGKDFDKHSQHYRQISDRVALLEK